MSFSALIHSVKKICDRLNGVLVWEFYRHWFNLRNIVSLVLFGVEVKKLQVLINIPQTDRGFR